jgi:NADPH-dependent 2,4-dienoyl-CoA reductase/sulfur reductase-like enzyme
MTHDLLIIGAGPAGISAATTARRLGLNVAILDEQQRAGGQIYRDVAAVPPQVGRILGPDYLHGKGLVNTLEAARVEQHFSTMVWDIAADLTVSAVKAGRSFQLQAPQIIVATGAMERASPIPGWTLPGVLNAGAAQIAMKSGGSIPSGRIVLAGGGPLLLLVAGQLLEAGADVAAVVETSPVGQWRKAARHAWGALMAPGMLAKGLGMISRLKKAGVPWFKVATELRVEGATRAQALAFASAGQQHRIDADVVLLHHGVVPNTQMTRMLHLAHDWNAAQLAWHPRHDAYGETSRPGVRIAGDGGGIAGALAAEASGTLATLGAAHALGRLPQAERDQLARAPASALRAQDHIRPFLDALYCPPAWITAPVGDTIVCRCEEVTATQIAGMAKLGCLGPNQTKFFSRCGMGPCQGRVCGLAVTGILARELGQTPDRVGAYHVRSPLKPIPLSAIARHTPLKTGSQP